MKPRKGVRGWDSPVCTAPRCRKQLENGDAVQFLDKDGEEQRYCDPCWTEYARDPEPVEEVTE